MKGWQWLLVVVLLVVVAGGAVVAVRKLSDSEAARLAKLQPDVRGQVEQLRQALAAEGIETFVGSTKRTDAEQDAKVAAGVSTTTNSWHELGRALELYVMGTDKAGKLQPDIKVEFGTEAKYRRMHQVSKRFGFNGIPYSGAEDGGAPFTTAGKRAYLSNGVWDVGHLEHRMLDGGTYDTSKALTWAKAAKRLGVA